MTKTVVLQSYRERGVPAWIEACLESVRDWAAARGAAYRFVGDALFDRVPLWYRQRTLEVGRPMVASDLARIRLADEALAEGFDRAIWLDADVLVFGALRLPPLAEAAYLFGVETWVQPSGKAKRLKAYRKIHNALSVYSAGDPMRAFYAEACARLVRKAAVPPPPLLCGPGLLGVLDNLMALPVTPAVGTLSPRVLRDVLDGDGPAATLHRARHPGPMAAANLAASMAAEGHDGARLDASEMLAVCERLQATRGAAVTPPGPQPA